MYDYLEEISGPLPVAERSLRNYIRYLTETDQLRYNINTRGYYPVCDPPHGRQIQIDFGEYRTRCGMKLYIFAAVLSVSRYKYYALQERAFTSMDLINHLLDCFEHIAGIPGEIVTDQDKTMVVSENKGDIIYTEKVKYFIEEMGMRMYVCRKNDPESKGKIENAIQYIKNNILSVR